MLHNEKQDFITLGVVTSLLIHLAIGYGAFVVGVGQMEPFPEPIVYSVSMESGKILGGITQVPVEEPKGAVAPVKNVSGEEPVEPPEVKEKPEEKKIVPPDEPEPDAEVSLAPTARPTPVPTKEVPPTPQPKPKEEKKPTPAPAKATAKPSPKPQPTKKPKNTSDEVDKRLQQGVQRWLGGSTDAGNGRRFGSGQVGSGSGMGGPNVRPPEFFAYQKLIQGRVKDAWRWYDKSTSLITQITFKIDPAGKVDEVYVVKSSGNTEYDESVVRAVYKASPLPPPPESVYEFFKHVRITFDPRDF